MTPFEQTVHHYLTHLYGPRAGEVQRRIGQHLANFRTASTASPPANTAGHDAPTWSEKDQWVICYGDSILDEGTPPLAVLDTFLQRYLGDAISGVHVLPFFPWSSDDGFSVIHYREVNSELGEWAHIQTLASHYDLMADLVLNHVSRESLWFVDYLTGSLPGRDYFIEVDPDTDVSQVTRPRSSPLLVPISTRRGTRHVWATFSEDQIDLNFENPDVLLEFVGILLFYLQQGVRIIRLDAVAFLWKRLGTSCIHLPETHTVVRLLRAIVDEIAPGTLLITETNVPHAENISYFGLERLAKGAPDEAHMVYQFALPPLLLHTLTRGEATTIQTWLNSLPVLPEQCTYLNFTASHDGIGVRPLEGLLPDHERDALLELMHRFGGFVSMRSNPDGSDTPYEINITWFEAMCGTRRGPDPWQIARFLCSQAIMLSLQGIPALYIHTLTGTLNDVEGVERSGRLRSINRRRWQLDELALLLESPSTPTHDVFHALHRLLVQRRQEPCFHPNAPQRVIETPPELLAIERGPLRNGRRLLALYNVTDGKFDLAHAGDALNQALTQYHWQPLDPLTAHHEETLPPYAVRWLAAEA
ncbi:MAG TPA: alpha-amylase [Halomonas sp.]|jgi:sucrose phosphorylase|uniref:Sucrose phosphorylase n=1 Tax=Vreelandella aquamarina TaxID=77097 RepID=A0A6F8SWV8_9GAMM|nr:MULTISPECIES: sugar phosphorylase [Halomonas]NQY78391.1 sugar phosphorylase [Halomonas sp.]BCA92417.1 sucrose phosphorylase [Halomonas meridiana]HAY16013.1 alpha-amylase [Halomonas sp.]HBN58676.1 alpha-amylase [Halomonas sp.]|tara:strand:- start:3557 stop:5317 length:1761 start_codon:yes stop_codon:yes gene_type:complete